MHTLNIALLNGTGTDRSVDFAQYSVVYRLRLLFEQRARLAATDELFLNQTIKTQRAGRNLSSPGRLPTKLQGTREKTQELLYLGHCRVFFVLMEIVEISGIEMHACRVKLEFTRASSMEPSLSPRQGGRGTTDPKTAAGVDDPL